LLSKLEQSTLAYLGQMVQQLLQIVVKYHAGGQVLLVNWFVAVQSNTVYALHTHITSHVAAAKYLFDQSFAVDYSF
jgi:hypothetical protein